MKVLKNCYYTSVLINLLLYLLVAAFAHWGPPRPARALAGPQPDESSAARDWEAVQPPLPGCVGKQVSYNFYL